MTGQTLLDLMALLNAELRTTSGGADVTKSLTALNAAQDYFESVAAQRANVYGSTSGTVATVASTETTAFPTGLLRLDRLHRLDSASLPVFQLQDLKAVGAHFSSSGYPYNLLATGKGAPQAYWTNGTLIYWAPQPDAAYTVRWYGFTVASDISAAGTFAYEDIVALPIASFATRLFKLGLDDESADLSGLATQTFASVLDTLGNFSRDQAPGFHYTQTHRA